MLGDDALIYVPPAAAVDHPAPELEEETALANIALDLLGQARMLLARAGRPRAGRATRTTLAFFRDEHEFRNVRLVERADGDFAQLVARLLRLLRLAARAVRPAARLAPTRCSPRSPPRASRSWPTTATTRPSGCPPRRRHRAVARAMQAAPRRDLAAGRRAVPRRPGGGRAGRRSGRPGELRGRGRRRARRRARRGHPRPPAGRRRSPRRGRAGRDGVHTERSATCSPSCRASRAPTRTRHGDAPTRSTAACAVAAAVPDPELPMLTLADLGILRDVATADGASS